MELRGCTVAGIGSYVPENVLTNADLEEMVDTSDEWIVSHTGIRERRVISDDEATSDLGLRASERALQQAGVAAEDLDLIICSTVTSDTVFPATAAVLEDKLGAKRAATYDLVTGCTGYAAAMITGSQFVQTGAYDNVLILAAESLTRVTNWEDRTTCVLFGDGAGAAVLGPTEPGHGLLAFEMDTQGFAGEFLTIPSSGSAWPPDEKAINENATKIYMNGHEIFKMAVRGVPDVAERCMAQVDFDFEDVDWMVMHQANQRILDSAAARLGIAEEKVVSNVEKYGNTSAASMGIALDEIHRDGRLKKGDLVLLVGFGAGFSLAAALLEWDGENSQ
jgi:3-oxoacyl-[acyl-carrier-protein] synthase-3